MALAWPRPRFALLAAAALGGAAAAPANAAPGEESVRRAAGCVLGADRRRSATLSQAVPGSDGERAAWAAMSPLIQRCFARARLADTPEARALVAGQLAERLYVRTTRFFRRQVISTTVTTAGALSLPAIVSDRTEGWPPEAALAECAAAGAPNEVDRLLRTRAGSRADSEAMRAIRATLPACLNQGRQMAMSRARLRAELARAFYRYMNPPIETGVKY